MAEALWCMGEQQCRLPLVNRFDGQTSLFSHEILRESSTRREEHSYGGRFNFNSWIVRSMVGRLNPKTFI